MDNMQRYETHRDINGLEARGEISEESMRQIFSAIQTAQTHLVVLALALAINEETTTDEGRHELERIAYKLIADDAYIQENFEAIVQGGE